jgi:hypothetical protein
MLAASDDHIHGWSGGRRRRGERAVEEMKRKRKKNTEQHRAHHMEDKEKQGVLMTSIMCGHGC